MASICLIKPKTSTIKVSEYFQIKKPTYVILRIIPARTTNTTQLQQLGKLVAYTQMKITKNIQKVEKTWVYNSPGKCSYFVDISKSDIGFYFIVPQMYEGMAKSKIYAVWPNANIEIVPKLRDFSTDSVAYELHYEKEDAFSLSADAKGNGLMSSLLNVVDVMAETDRIGIYYNFLPSAQKGWDTSYKTAMQKYKNDQTIKKNRWTLDTLAQASGDLCVDIMQEFVNGMIEAFGGKPSKATSESKNRKKAGRDTKEKPSRDTIIKRDSLIVDTQIAVYSQSETKRQAQINALSMCQSYHTIKGDNELRLCPISVPKQPLTGTEFRIPQAKVNKLSTLELTNFFHMPSTSVLDMLRIKHNPSIESPVAKDLLEGYVPLGTSTYKGDESKCFMSTDKNLANLGLVVLGPQGSGKTTLFGALSEGAASVGENVVVIDFIKKCDLSDTIARHTPQSRLIQLDISKFEDMQSFGFNEVRHLGMETPTQRLDVANMQSQLTLNFINSINPDAELSRAMRRCLNAACCVVYIQPNTSLRDVVNCLENHEIRHQYINNIPEELQEELRDSVNSLLLMDDYDKKGNLVGTRESKLDFLMDRIDLLMEDRRLKSMFNKPISQNLDFVDELNKGRTILIRIPEFYFPTQFHKNILVTFFISKLWLAAQIRGNQSDHPLRTNVVLDEIFQAPTSYGLLEPILLQARKFQFKFIFSAHFLNKLGSLKEHLKASGASYMFLQGTDKANFTEMEEDLAPFELSHLLTLKRYHSLNYIRCENGYSKFITKLPPPLD